MENEEKNKKPHKSKREKWMDRIGKISLVVVVLGLWTVCLINLFSGNPITHTDHQGSPTPTWTPLVFLIIVTPIGIIAVWQDRKGDRAKKAKGRFSKN
jgi:protein-S-isoprenylcysteine O-methyltransferase Ste14